MTKYSGYRITYVKDIDPDVFLKTIRRQKWILRKYFYKQFNRVLEDKDFIIDGYSLNKQCNAICLYVYYGDPDGN